MRGFFFFYRGNEDEPSPFSDSEDGARSVQAANSAWLTTTSRRQFANAEPEVRFTGRPASHDKRPEKQASE